MTFKENTYEFTNLVDLVLTNSRNTSDSHPLYIDADTEESINYGDFKRLVKQATFGFLDIGIKKGDSICVYSPNNVRKKKWFQIYHTYCFYRSVFLLFFYLY